MNRLKNLPAARAIYVVKSDARLMLRLASIERAYSQTLKARIGAMIINGYGVEYFVERIVLSNLWVA
jgi:hypothetical protein